MRVTHGTVTRPNLTAVMIIVLANTQPGLSPQSIESRRRKLYDLRYCVYDCILFLYFISCLRTRSLAFWLARSFTAVNIVSATSFNFKLNILLSSMLNLSSFVNTVSIAWGLPDLMFLFLLSLFNSPNTIVTQFLGTRCLRNKVIHFVKHHQILHTR